MAECLSHISFILTLFPFYCCRNLGSEKILYFFNSKTLTLPLLHFNILKLRYMLHYIEWDNVSYRKLKSWFYDPGLSASRSWFFFSFIPCCFLRLRQQQHYNLITETEIDVLDFFLFHYCPSIFSGKRFSYQFYVMVVFFQSWDFL